MNEKPTPFPIETIEQYHAYLDEIGELCAIDPDPTSPEGARLHALADVVERYESVNFHFP